MQSFDIFALVQGLPRMKSPTGARRAQPAGSGRASFKKTGGSRARALQDATGDEMHASCSGTKAPAPRRNVVSSLLPARHALHQRRRDLVAFCILVLTHLFNNEDVSSNNEPLGGQVVENFLLV